MHASLAHANWNKTRRSRISLLAPDITGRVLTLTWGDLDMSGVHLLRVDCSGALMLSTHPAQRARQASRRSKFRFLSFSTKTVFDRYVAGAKALGDDGLYAHS